MDRRPNPTAKILCDELARALADAEGRQTLRLLARAAGGLAANGPGPAPAPVDSGIVGIWEPVASEDGLGYVRGGREAHQLWADVDRIPPKSQRRIVLLGESVARGYLYDPHYTPARVLQATLRASGDAGPIEVVDLARTNLGFGQLRSLMRASLALAPDVLVIFAGNNWGPFNGLDALQQRRLLPLLTQPSGWREARALLEAHVRTHVEALFHELGELCRRGLPVIFVLPAFNLADWRCSPDILPLLDKPEVLAWRAALADAEQALPRGDFARAEDQARACTALDHGTVGRPFEILAESMRACGRLAERRHALEQARDAEFLFPRASTPRCFGVIERAIRCQAAAQPIPLVDLPARLQTCAPDGLAGRSLFLDYCHLTSDGIRVAMASIAGSVLDALGGPHRPWTALRAITPAPAPMIGALGSLFAAHHNALLDQPSDLIAYHCREALRQDVGIAPAMADLTELQIRRVPMMLCGAFERFRRIAGKAVEYYCDPGDGIKFPNVSLMRAVIEALQPVEPSAARRLEALWRAEQDGPRRSVGLLDRRYWQTVFTRMPDWTRLGHYRAYSSVSRFVLPLHRPAAVDLVLTLRVGAIATAGDTIEVRVNDRPVHTVAASHDWQTIGVAISPEQIAHGLNRLSIVWPVPARAWNEERLTLMRNGDLELGASLYPIFGEIVRFDVELPETVTEVDARQMAQQLRSL